MENKPGTGLKPLFLSILAAVIIIRLWLTNGIIFQGIPGNTIDDGLFIHLARNILTTGWLGDLDMLTLAKGPFYSFFLAGSFVLGLPIVLAHELFFIFACCVTWLALRPLIRNEWINLLFFTLLVFEPAGFANGIVNHSIREGIFFSLTLLVFGSGMAITLRLFQKKKIAIAWVILMGLSLGALFLTREERFWVYPYLILWAIITLVIAIKRKYSIIHTGLYTAIPLLLSGAMMLVVILINGQKYGAYAVIEADIPAYKAAYGALLRVKPSIKLDMIPVSKATRELIYSVSPSFRELQPFIEGAVGDAYRSLGSGVSPQVEINGTFFNWVFIEAVERAGYYSQGNYPHDYYLRMAAEINQACDDGRLECYSKRTSLATPWKPEYLGPTIRNFFDLSKTTLALDWMKFLPRGYEAISDSNHAFEEISLEIVWHINQKDEIRGWVVYTGGPVNLAVTTADGQPVNSTTKFFISPDIHEYLLKKGVDVPAAERSRFTLSTPCDSHCFLEFRSDERLLTRLPIDSGIVSQNADNADGLFFNIESHNSMKSNINERPFTYKLVTHIIPILKGIYAAYKLVILPLLLIACLAFLYQMVVQIRRKELSVIWVMSSLAIVLLVSRLALLAYIKATLFNSFQLRYLSPLHPLVIIFIFYNCYEFVTEIIGKKKTSTPAISG
jgi:hypothetical protein